MAVGSGAAQVGCIRQRLFAGSSVLDYLFSKDASIYTRSDYRCFGTVGNDDYGIGFRNVYEYWSLGLSRGFPVAQVGGYN